MIQMMNRNLVHQKRIDRMNAMIISTYTFDKSPLQPTFYNHSTCSNCCKPIFQSTKGVKDYWMHTESESEYCKSRYLNLRNDYDVDMATAAPVFGPVNLELMWQ
jgi:hypothetical protein